MHERLLDILQSRADVRLVSALRNPQLGMPNPKDIRIFIPDLHLISEKRRIEGGFTYGTNHTDLLTRVVTALGGWKAQAAPDEVVEVYQIGDFLDLWREAATTDESPEVPARIKDDHQELVLALLDRRLKTHFLLGNHDFDLYRWPDYAAWERRYYIPDDGTGILLLHGDYFDWVERLPEAVKEIFVNLFAARVPATTYVLGKMRALTIQMHAGRSYRNYIRAAQPAPIGAVRLLRDRDIPPEWNVQRAGVSDAESLKFLDLARQECLKANQQFGLNIRVAVIGHTHHARIAVEETDNGGLFTLIDCGAWIEDCQAQGDAAPAPNAQIAALAANEARIYQLAPKP
jgi:UDP-2,3-diacylglucosamine pyrophosphatase LpxH